MKCTCTCNSFKQKYFKGLIKTEHIDKNSKSMAFLICDTCYNAKNSERVHQSHFVNATLKLILILHSLIVKKLHDVCFNNIYNFSLDTSTYITLFAIYPFVTTVQTTSVDVMTRLFVFTVSTNPFALLAVRLVWAF